MLVAGYHQVSSRDAVGRKVTGYRLYGLDRVDGVTGYMPITVFVPSTTLATFGMTPQSLLGESIEIEKDPYGRLCKLAVNTPNFKNRKKEQ